MSCTIRMASASGLIAVLALIVACGGDADAAKTRHLNRGNAFFAEKKYAEAIDRLYEGPGR